MFRKAGGEGSPYLLTGNPYMLPTMFHLQPSSPSIKLLAMRYITECNPTHCYSSSEQYVICFRFVNRQYQKVRAENTKSDG